MNGYYWIDGVRTGKVDIRSYQKSPLSIISSLIETTKTINSIQYCANAAQLNRDLY